MTADLYLAKMLASEGRVDRTVLAGALQALRRDSGYSVEEFARLSGLSVVLLGQAESGRSVPARDVISGYLQASDAQASTRAMIRKTWERARATGAETMPSIAVDATGPDTVIVTKPALRRLQGSSSADPALWPHPDDVTSVEEFTAAFMCIKESTGMSYTRLAEASGRVGYPLARTTIHGLCTKKKLPGTSSQVECFIAICGGDPALRRAWCQTWQRLKTASPEVDAVASAVTTCDEEDGVPLVCVSDPEPVNDDPSASAPDAPEPPTTAWWRRRIQLRASVPMGLLVFAVGAVFGAAALAACSAR